MRFLKGLWGDPRFEKLKEMLAAPERMQKEIEKDIQAGELAAAVVNLEELAERPASSGKLRGWAHFRRGELLLKLDRPQESIQSLEHALQYGYPIEQTAFRMATSHAVMGQREEALVHLSHALEVGFADPELLGQVLKKWNLGDEEARQKMVQRAEMHAKKRSLEVKKKQSLQGV